MTYQNTLIKVKITVTIVRGKKETFNYLFLKKTVRRISTDVTDRSKKNKTIKVYS